MGQWIDFQQTINQRLSREELDKEQTKVKNFQINGHTLVRGVAGSGKSLVLRNRVERLIDEYEQILVLSYNRFMNGWLNSKLKEKSISKQVNCLTFHKWAYHYLRYDYKLDRDNDNRKQVINLAQKSDIKYQAILVDEAQDFYDEWFLALLEILDKSTNSLFFVYDNTQSVYGQSHRRKAGWVWSKLGINITGRSQIFDVNYRNSPEILELSWKFISPSLSQANMVVSNKIQARGKISNIIKPIKNKSRSSDIEPLLLQMSCQSMPREIAQQVKDALATYQKSSIGILTHPQEKYFRQEISRELSKYGIPHHAPTTSQDRDKNVVDRPFVIVDSWNALKGVEFDAVIIVGLDKATENPIDVDIDFQEKAGIYTAMTRARDHLIILYEVENSIVNMVEDALNSPETLECKN